MARRKPHAEEAEDGERWLLTYADMMTLLVALFIVLFSISSVNKSKLETVQKSLTEAFSGKVLPGGKGLTEGSSSQTDNSILSAAFMPDPTAQQQKGTASKTGAGEQRELERIQHRIEARARAEGASGQVTAKLDRDGLRVRILADRLLFGSGDAAITPRGAALVADLGASLSGDTHAVVVEGHTDSVPIHSATYPSNWELSSARASAVVRGLAAHGVAGRRLTAAGRADLDPVAAGGSPTARELNRRVEILLPRRAGA